MGPSAQARLDDVERDISVLQNKLRQWEEGFVERLGRKPTVEDAEDNVRVRDRYRRLGVLRSTRQALQAEAEVERANRMPHNQTMAQLSSADGDALPESPMKPGQSPYARHPARAMGAAFVQRRDVKIGESPIKATKALSERRAGGLATPSCTSAPAYRSPLKSSEAQTTAHSGPFPSDVKSTPTKLRQRDPDAVEPSPGAVCGTPEVARNLRRVRLSALSPPPQAVQLREGVLAAQRLAEASSLGRRSRALGRRQVLRPSVRADVAPAHALEAASWQAEICAPSPLRRTPLAERSLSPALSGAQSVVRAKKQLFAEEATEGDACESAPTAPSGEENVSRRSNRSHTENSAGPVLLPVDDIGPGGSSGAARRAPAQKRKAKPPTASGESAAPISLAKRAKALAKPATVSQNYVKIDLRGGGWRDMRKGGKNSLRRDRRAFARSDLSTSEETRPATRTAFASRQRDALESILDKFETTVPRPKAGDEAQPQHTGLDAISCAPASGNIAPLCPGHQAPCALLTVKKKNRNHGRQFYACSVGRDDWRSFSSAGKRGRGGQRGCDFFMWADDMSGNVLDALGSSVSEQEFAEERLRALRARWDSSSLAQLKAHLRRLGLSVAGKKEALVERLVESAQEKVGLSAEFEAEYLAILGSANGVAPPVATAKVASQGGHLGGEPELECITARDAPPSPQVEPSPPRRRSPRHSSEATAQPSTDTKRGEGNGSATKNAKRVCRRSSDDASCSEGSESESSDEALESDDAGAGTTKGRRAKPKMAPRSQASPPDIVLRVLREAFGFEGFRGDQRWAIDRVLAGKSTMLVQATGSGKSLCYQIPAILLPGLTVVISPLVSLMEDQLKSLPVALPGACLNGQQSGVETAKTINALRERRVKVLFLSPERLFSSSFQRLLRTPGVLPEISLVCVDEAHCISSWSHNFRPSYLRLRELLAAGAGGVSRDRHDLACLNPKCVLALTATATGAVVRDVCDVLAIDQVEGTRVGSWARPNLAQRADFVPDAERHKRVEALFADGGPLAKPQPSIVYVRTRWEAEVVTERLRSKGVSARFYHGGMSGADRDKAQAAFMKGSTRVIVATIAFGMGIDKADIRGVVHVGLPRSVEDYVQGIGRAGRDGRPAQCFTLFDDADARKLHSLSFSDGVSRSSLVQLLRFLYSRRLQSQVAVDTEALSREFDIKPAVIETVLVYLSLPPFSMLRLLPSGYATVTVAALRKTETLHRSVAYQAVRAAAPGAAQHRVDLVEVSDSLGLSVSGLIRELSLLQDRREVSLQFSEPAMFLRVVAHDGQQTAWADLGAVADRVLEVVTGMEKSQTAKVEDVFSLMVLLCHPGSLPDQLQGPARAAARATRRAIGGANREEQASEAEAADSGAEEDWDEAVAVPHVVEARLDEYFTRQAGVQSSLGVPIPFEGVADESNALVLSDIASLYRDRAFREGSAATGLVLARILHGIPSPAFPMNVWRQNPFWGRRAGFSFPHIASLARLVVQQLRAPPRAAS